MIKNWYQILNVEETASPQEIKKAYHRLAKEYHPDEHKGQEEKFREVCDAYQILSDPVKRREFDLSLKQMRTKKQEQKTTFSKETTTNINDTFDWYSKYDTFRPKQEEPTYDKEYSYEPFSAKTTAQSKPDDQKPNYEKSVVFNSDIASYLRQDYVEKIMMIMALCSLYQKYASYLTRTEEVTRTVSNLKIYPETTTPMILLVNPKRVYLYRYTTQPCYMKVKPKVRQYVY